MNFNNVEQNYERQSKEGGVIKRFPHSNSNEDEERYLEANTTKEVGAKKDLASREMLRMRRPEGAER